MSIRRFGAMFGQSLGFQALLASGFDLWLRKTNLSQILACLFTVRFGGLA